MLSGWNAPEDFLKPKRVRGVQPHIHLSRERDMASLLKKRFAQ